ncbi:MAG TPA: hypothetical protein PK156_02830, partial [Polyangium sp.]|nr:hypothetical protein [Polyangium sp.]
MKHRAAITRIQVEQSEGGKTVIGSRGTGVLITEQLILTALHVVANRSVKPPVFHPGTITLKFPWGTTTATPVTNALNPDLDWVLLECAGPIDAHQAQPIPFGDVTANEKDIAWETFGFPDANPEGMRLVGEVRMLETEWQGQPVLQLYSDEAAAGDGSPVAGLSGAPCIVEDALVGVVRSSLLTKEKRNVAGTLFACPLSRILEDIAQKCPELRLPIADPCRGLPGLPVRDLPGAPYRLLARYEEADAEVFFGRNAAIRELHDKLTDPDAPRIVLLYGQSGAGKSSLLEAGLFPRLRKVQAIEYRRRKTQRSLSDEFRDAIQNDWLARETKEEKPLLVVLDQVEEVFTVPRGKPDEEIIELLRVLKDIWARPSSPRGRLLLSLRKEWLPELKARIDEMRLSASMMFLERLDRQGIIDVVHGLSSTRRLQRRYGAEIQPNLGILIADDLLEDYGSPIAPTLQIILSKLWAKATDESPDAPKLHVKAYQELKSKGILLSDYLRAEIANLPKHLRPYVEIGLVDDLLEAHTTFLGTGAAIDADALRARYAHVAPEILIALQNALEKGYLLTRPASRELQQKDETRLGHDTLAPLVRERYRRSDKPGQRARRLLEVRAGTWEQNQSGTPLDADDLEQVENGLSGMRVLTDAEKRLLKSSRSARRTGLIINTSVIALVVAMGGLLVVMWMGSIKSQAKAEQDANRIHREQAARHFEFSHDKTDLRQALVHMSRAIEIAPDDDPRLDLYIARAVHLFAQLPTTNVRVTEEWVSHTAVSADGSRVLVLDRSSEDVRTYPVDMGELREGMKIGNGVRLLDDRGNAFKYGQQGPPIILSNDGHWVLGYWTSGMQIWDSRTGNIACHIDAPPGYVLKGAKWDPLSKNVFAILNVGKQGTRIWLAASFDDKWQTVPFAADEPEKLLVDRTLGFDATGRALVVAIEMAKEDSKGKGEKVGPDRLRVIDARSRKAPYLQDVGISLPGKVHDVALDPSGQRIVVLHDGDKPDPTDDRLDVWDVISGKQLATIAVDTSGRFKSTASPRLLVVGENASKIVYARRDRGDPTIVRPFEPAERTRIEPFEIDCESYAQPFLGNHAMGCQVKEDSPGVGFRLFSMDSTLPVDQKLSNGSSWLTGGSKGDKIFT